ncbi:MAG: RDD family protein [Alphaproteobacteria bacterium]|nr:RDD family protein [Alphaproteobacteria bacterium]
MGSGADRAAEEISDATARAIARTIDVWWPGMLVGFAMAAAWGVPARFQLPQDVPGGVAFALAASFSRLLTLLMEAAVGAVFGVTPGKALLGLRLRTLDGRQPDLRLLMKRALLIWANGYGFGIPFVSIGTNLSYWRRADSGEVMPWDAACGTKVVGESAPFRYVVGLLLVAWGTALVAGTPIWRSSRSGMSPEANSRYADRANAGLPRMINGRTRFDRVEANGSWLEFRYTLLDTQPWTMQRRLALKARLDGTVRPRALRIFCLPNGLGASGAHLKLVYRGSQGSTVGAISMTPADCRDW